MFVGRHVECPDCGRPLLIVADGPKGFLAKKVEVADDSPARTADKTAATTLSEAKSEPHSRRKSTSRKMKPGADMPQAATEPSHFSRWMSVVTSPLGVSWTVAGCATLMLLVALWPSGDEGSGKQAVLSDAAPPANDAPPTPADDEINDPSARPKPQQLPHADFNEPKARWTRFPQRLDPKVPGDPGDPRRGSAAESRPDGKPFAAVDNPQKPAPPDAPARQPLVKPAKRPREPVEAVKPADVPLLPKKIDVAARLSQKIRAYSQTRAVPLRDLLMHVEEMAGVPIRFDKKEFGTAAEILDKLATVRKLQDTTVGGILQALLEPAGLTYEIEADGIRLHRSSSGADGEES